MHAAVARLIEIVPPGSPRRTRDWNGVERVLGTQLPEDYKELVEVYGGGVFDKTVWLFDPHCPDEDYNLVAQSAEREEVLARLWQSEPKPAELDGPGTRVLPWASIEDSGAMLYWLAGPGQSPNEWTVLFNEGRGPEWEHHATQCASFLLAVLTGESESSYFPDLPTDTHQFDSNDEILGEKG
ncbi:MULTISPECIES: SMI1/KNR4 family protein [unclassified Streptomyces]|jgi:hypothetical protein|uniref:SMI1/KNR4 family protein n=1 Tax=Streptomyces thermocoprophilus TaxID=78356 RepID=A0ABV5VIG1_9ACTN